jgi:hypothetical protein
MKSALTKSAINAYAEALAAERAVEAAARLKALSAIFHGLTSRPLSELLDLLDRVQQQQDELAENSQNSIALAVKSLRNLEQVVRKTSTNNRLNDLVAFRTRLELHESAKIDWLVNAVQFLRRGESDGGTVSSDQYTELAQRLKAALGRDDQFNPLFEQLAELDAEGVARVTKALMSSGSTRSRKRDLQKIRERHEAHRSLLAKQRAMAGRSAA